MNSHLAYFLNLKGYPVAGGNFPHAWRCAGTDDITGVERHNAGNMGNHLWYLNQHISRMHVLARYRIGVEPEPDTQIVRISYFVGSHEPGADGRKAIIRFTGRAIPLPSYRDVEHTCIAQDVFQCLLFRNVFPTLADNETQL